MAEADFGKGIAALDKALDNDSTSSNPAEANIVINRNWEKRASNFRWFHPDDGAAERRVILKLDLYILAFACVGFWVRCDSRLFFPLIMPLND